MKIAFLHLRNYFKVIGTTEPYYITKYLSANNQLFVFIPRNEKVDSVRKRDGFLIQYWSSERIKVRWRTISYNFLLLPFLLLSYRRNKFDIVYTYKRVILPAILLKSIFGVKWVCDFRTSPLGQEREIKKIVGESSVTTSFFHKFLDLLNKVFLKRADMVIVISKEIGKELVDVYKVKPEKIYHLPLGVDLDSFNLKNDDLANSSDDYINLIYVGTITSYRGIDTIIKALVKVISKRSNIILKLVGKGEEEDVKALKRLAEGLGVNDHIEWVGEIAHDEVAREIAESTIALSPLPDIESFRVSSPAKVFEYLALNKVVLASDILAHRKIIKHRENGMLIEPDDDEKWADTIIDVIENANLRHSLEKKARKSIEANDWKIMVRRLEEKLKDIVVYE